MIIRKLFRFEAAHIVRDCSTDRCKENIHGHSFIVELFLQSDTLDNAGMVYDFGLLKGPVKSFIDAFDHCYLLWAGEKESFKTFIKNFNKRWIEFPFNPTSETLSLFLHKGIQDILDHTSMNNGEGKIKVKSVRLHETATGYAETEDGEELLKRIPLPSGAIFSPGILEGNYILMDYLKNGEKWQDIL
jgi:6-pyruvoyltetrahydropterin/6-carboxytetrahydropterin synthase